jgi:hypothetical protein
MNAQDLQVAAYRFRPTFHMTAEAADLLGVHVGLVQINSAIVQDDIEIAPAGVASVLRPERRSNFEATPSG